MFLNKVLSIFVSVTCASVLASSAHSAPKLAPFEPELSRVFPESDRFKEIVFDPRLEGGSTLVGLVARLLGEYPSKKYEGIDVSRYLYHAFKDDKLVGIAHGSAIETPSGIANVYVFYGMDQEIKSLKVDNIPERIHKELSAGGYLAQFIGHQVEDFEKQRTVKRRRRKKIRGWRQGDFLKTSKRPKSRELRSYYDKILRSVRFNAAFVDVAFFITKHPELDEHERISNKAVSGPEIETKGQGAKKTATGVLTTN